MILRNFLAIWLWIAGVFALNATEWARQSIYQVLTDRFARTDGSTSAACNTAEYCGGTWRGLINNLDYIKEMGFTAVWISPIVAQIEAAGNQDGDSYHGFWAKDFNSLNSRFGTANDLKDLSDALHTRGMYLMVDIVTNHMAYAGCMSCVDYSTLSPFNSQSNYHSPCSIDYSSQTSIEQCWQGSNNVALADLRTEDSNVRSFFNQWIANIVSTYGIDGLRIDSAKHQETSFWPEFENNAGVFMLGEVYEGDPNKFLPYMGVFPGLLNYPVWYWVQRAFQSTSATVTELVTGLNTMKSGTAQTNYLGSFLENHDQPRMPAWSSQSSDDALIKNALAFTILADGIPVIYQGQEQKLTGGNIPSNREALWRTGFNRQADLYKYIAVLNQFRNTVIFQDQRFTQYQAIPWQVDSHTFALRKGYDGSQVVSVFNNIGSSGSSYSVSLLSSSTGFGANLELVDVIACESHTTSSSGALSFTMGSMPKAFYRKAALAGTGLCPALSGSSTATTAPTTSSSSSGVCTTPSSVAVSFTVKVTTEYGQTVKIVGNHSSLGSWDTTKAITLSASQYTSSNPIWVGTVNLPAGASIQYKFINVASSGTVTWEADPNRTFTVPAACGTTAAAVQGTWQ
ncbi:hypothetical protein jhhlp_008469 [Lomentospora prolificans]|uniref:alpha-amylase n=1 Tax=Lomentospora prolificans TaxID=41688 RepID=A0A2N3MY56_9PEZI|nr:hypothetical protein jhhlp_008469 [Lomentospora prolificans]